MKNSKNKIISLTIFLLLMLFSIGGISYILSDRETTFSAVYSEPKNSVDVLIVGSSHVNSGYIPSLLWGSNGLSAVNAFSWSQPMWVSYHYIAEALKSQSPEYIVLEMYGMVYGHSYIMPEEIDKTSYNNSFNIDPGFNRWQLMKTSEKCGIDLRNAEDFLYISRYHTRWKNFNLSYLAYNSHKQHDYLKGYGYLTNAAGLGKPNVEINDELLQPYEYCVEYLDKIVDLCNKKGIKLIFTMTPYIYAREETGVINWVDNYAREHNIPFFNYLYGDDCERIDFDYNTDLSDMGHCNYYGAVKITDDLCNYFKSLGYTGENKSEHSYRDMLQTDYEKFERVPAITELMEESNLSQWIKNCDGDNNITLYINVTDNNTKNEISSCVDDISFLTDNFAVISKYDYEFEDNAVIANLFDKEGRVTFDDTSSEIYLNGTAVPGGENHKIKIVLYDNVLERPVHTLWFDGDKFNSKEFTSDIINNYK